ncbi:TonB-dependent receptor [Salibacter halophilus]|uniref:TonB-dependent receptor n=1 Tax=Salibacter halophilus TaxID=1803916 RepID=A0A6N6M8F1_9FLAO|nr:TonB-dependent receptor [Salibacter halophilus]KAB1064527.1 TonB-dependent receptor [Salibacter halophilus]
MRSYIIVAVLLLTSQFNCFGQITINGQISNTKGEPLPLSSIQVVKTNKGTTADENGNFNLKLEKGKWTLAASFMGYKKVEKEIQINNSPIEVNFQLQRDLLGLNEVSVTATRSEVPVYEAPVIVNQIDSKVLENTQSLSISEGLSFSPGLRLENNCQNCGFTQLRMNGLDGAYSQILINGRPIFSALTGVYGLDMIPSNMVEKIEVVRGGGSALYGGNAIAGTVNIITKDPYENTFEVGTNYGLINGESADRTFHANGTIVSEDYKKGISLYAMDRSRDHWDANGDGFSEITEIENTTFGFDAYYKPTSETRIKANLFSIREYRRGGNDFDLMPHQADVAEKLDHNIIGGGLSYERFSKSYEHKISIYGSGQLTNRDSYYGAGGRVIGNNDTLTESDLLAINAYGNSNDIAAVGGAQYTFDPNDQWMIIAGSEYQYNNVEDNMPGYNREINQTVGTIGNYGQIQYNPISKLAILAGARYDIININGDYNFNGYLLDNTENLNVLVPRLSVKYDFLENFKLRLSYAQGYRAPQAFDEDLHIETVGGAARFTRISPNLATEKSNSYTASLNYTIFKDNLQANFVLEGFVTDLKNQFITTNQRELPNGVAIVTKRNGNGAYVYGSNIEANVALADKFSIQTGATIQEATYKSQEVIWDPTSSDQTQEAVTTGQILRTPSVYGFLSASYNITQSFTGSVSGVYTGSMLTPHIINPSNEYTILEKTPDFTEINLKLSYDLHFSDKENTHLIFFAGVQNILNSYQNDFDKGPNRDAGYVYGPSRPRTYFAGIKFGLE